MTEFKIGDVVCHKRWVHETGIIKEIKNIHAKKYANVLMNDGSWEQWYFTDLISATPAQVVEFYTVTIAGVRHRFYSHSDHNGKYIRIVHNRSLYDLFYEDGFGYSLINQHYKHLVLSVDDVEKMIPPTKGDE